MAEFTNGENQFSELSQKLCLASQENRIPSLASIKWSGLGRGGTAVMENLSAFNLHKGLGQDRRKEKFIDLGS